MAFAARVISSFFPHRLGRYIHYYPHVPDVAIVNAKIWTGDAKNPYADGLTISGNKIAYVGNSSTAFGLCTSSTNVIDAKGKFVVPGFTDSHIHLLMGGERLNSVQLGNVATKEEFIKRIGDFAKLHPNQWIIGGDWDHVLWGGELPDRDWIDAVTPNNPVWLNRKEGHMYLANTCALDRSRVNYNDKTLQVPGGTIVRRSNGVMSGILKDNAIDLVYPCVPIPSDAESFAALKSATDYLHANGVTSIHHMTEPPNRNRGGLGRDYEVYLAAHKQGLLKTRIYCSYPIHDWKKLVSDRVSFRNDSWLKLGCVKGYVDGSLGSHSALFLDDYSDTPGYKGDSVNDMSELYSWISHSDKAGLQVCIHAIGDAANRTLLQIYSRVARENGFRDRRFRIEHAQHLHPLEVKEMSKQGVIGSVQPYHAIDDGRFAFDILGDRISQAYPFRSMIDQGNFLAFGSDWFVAPVDPIAAITAAVTRNRDAVGGSGVFVKSECISVAEALYAHCVVPAFASFDEDIKGTLEVGKLADIAMIDKNLLECHEEELKYAQVMMTILDGKIVFQKHENAVCTKNPLNHDSSAPCPACYGETKTKIPSL